MADSRFVPRQWETALHCNDFSHWLAASLESALYQWSYALLNHHCWKIANYFLPFNAWAVVSVIVAEVLCLACQALCRCRLQTASSGMYRWAGVGVGGGAGCRGRGLPDSIDCSGTALLPRLMEGADVRITDFRLLPFWWSPYFACFLGCSLHQPNDRPPNQSRACSGLEDECWNITKMLLTNQGTPVRNFK